MSQVHSKKLSRKKALSIMSARNRLKKINRQKPCPLPKHLFPWETGYNEISKKRTLRDMGIYHLPHIDWCSKRDWMQELIQISGVTEQIAHRMVLCFDNKETFVRNLKKDCMSNPIDYLCTIVWVFDEWFWRLCAILCGYFD